MSMLRATVVGLVVLLAAAPVAAHHSFSVEFDIDKPITLHGTLTELEWVNPHGWLHMDVAGPDGEVVNWAVEMGNPTSLLRRGLRKSDFPPGIDFVVEGYLGQGRHADRQRHHGDVPGRAQLLCRLVRHRRAGTDSATIGARAKSVRAIGSGGGLPMPAGTRPGMRAAAGRPS